MGVLASFLCFDWYAGHPAYVESRSLFLTLGLTPHDVIELHKKFRCIDKDDSGSIQLIELLNYLDIERTTYTEKVFGMFDIDRSGHVDFPEFAIGLWNYCTLESNTLALFTFDLYDNDQSGVLQSGEVQEMLQDIYGTKFHQNRHARKIYCKLQQMEKKFKCYRDAFSDFTRKHPALLFPAFEAQSCIIKKCLGEIFWIGVTERRRKMPLAIGNIKMMVQERRQKDLHRKHKTGKELMEIKAQPKTKPKGAKTSDKETKLRDMTEKSAQENQGKVNKSQIQRITTVTAPTGFPICFSYIPSRREQCDKIIKDLKRVSPHDIVQ